MASERFVHTQEKKKKRTYTTTKRLKFDRRTGSYLAIGRCKHAITISTIDTTQHCGRSMTFQVHTMHSTRQVSSVHTLKDHSCSAETKLTFHKMCTYLFRVRAFSCVCPFVRSCGQILGLSFHHYSSELS